MCWVLYLLNTLVKDFPEFIVVAVPIVLQYPTEGADAAAISMNSFVSILPAANCSRAFQITVPEPARSPFHQPFNIGPTDNAIAGMFTVAAAIKSAGVVVGRVQDIRFDDKSFQAKVVLAMDVRYQFPKDSSLKILTSGLLGEQYIGIEAGSEVANLAQGDKVQSTQSAVVLENLISRFLYNKASDAGSAPAGN